jgi:hypothetical protein
VKSEARTVIQRLNNEIWNMVLPNRKDKVVEIIPFLPYSWSLQDEQLQDDPVQTIPRLS